MHPRCEAAMLQPLVPWLCACQLQFRLTDCLIQVEEVFLGSLDCKSDFAAVSSSSPEACPRPIRRQPGTAASQLLQRRALMCFDVSAAALTVKRAKHPKLDCFDSIRKGKGSTGLLPRKILRQLARK